MKRAALTSVIMLCIAGMAFAQYPDSLAEAGRSLIQQQVEHLEPEAEAGADLDELTAGLEHFLQHPLNLNAAGREELEKLLFLNDLQIRNLLDYRKKYGQFYTIYELKEIEGLGRNTLEKIAPFVLLAPYSEEKAGASVFLRGRHELILRYRRKLVTPAGYRIPANTGGQGSPGGSTYLGDPNAYYLRYLYRVRDRLSLCVLAEKDPGEPFIRPVAGAGAAITDREALPKGFDFYSFHLCFRRLGIIRTLVAGDFHAQFGQGLTLWTGMSFQGGSDPSSVKRYAGGIKPCTSSNESSFLRGGAATLRWRQMEMSILYSRNKIDANISYPDGPSTGGYATSMPEGGYHRTVNELSMRHTLLREVYGGNLSFTHDRFRLGLTLAGIRFEMPSVCDDIPAYIFRFRGQGHFNAGISYDILLKRTILFGELSAGSNGGWALLSGISHTTGHGSIFSLVVREYRPDYQNLLAGANGRRDHNANERGIRMLAEMPLPGKTTLQLSSEMYAYPWLTYQSVNAYRGSDHTLKLMYRPATASELSARYRFRTLQQKGSSNRSWVDSLQTGRKHEINAAARFPVSKAFSFKCQGAWGQTTLPGHAPRRSGTLLLLDMHYHPAVAPLKVTFRYALFNTDDYGSRIYAYENDLLYTSSMPAYYERGFRVYALLKYSPSGRIDTWLRLSLTCYADRESVGSGTEEISGNKVPEVKVQLRIKL